jgi:hypothetical protein
VRIANDWSSGSDHPGIPARDPHTCSILDDLHPQVASAHEINLGEIPMGWLFSAVERGMYWVEMLEKRWYIEVERRRAGVAHFIGSSTKVFTCILL